MDRVDTYMSGAQPTCFPFETMLNVLCGDMDTITIKSTVQEQTIVINLKRRQIHGLCDVLRILFYFYLNGSRAILNDRDIYSAASLAGQRVGSFQNRTYLVPIHHFLSPWVQQSYYQTRGISSSTFTTGINTSIQGEEDYSNSLRNRVIQRLENVVPWMGSDEFQSV